MQFFQWLFKATQEKGKDDDPGPTSQKEISSDDQVVGPKHIIVFKHDNGGVYYGGFRNVKGSKTGTYKKYLKLFLLCRKDIATACFYSTINLKRPSDININTKGQHWINNPPMMKMKKEDIAKGLGISKMDQGNHSGNKVIPTSDQTTLSTSTSSTTNDGQTSVGTTSEKKEKTKGDRAKTMSRMKELLRWAAAAKSEKAGKFMGRKVLQFRNRGALKALADEDQFSNESPKISFRWDVESCSTVSSAYSAISMPSNSALITQRSLDSITIIHDSDHTLPRKGNWITTDSEFVVLEL